MPLSEFDLINRYFSDGISRRDDVILGVGDDAALLTVAQGQTLVMSIDTLVEGVHFPAGSSAVNIGYKALAVNLSDLAAMGADPCWMLMALTLPEVNEQWLREFSDGLATLAASHQVALIGGDTTRGPLAVTVQISGLVPQGQAIQRGGACPGDLLYVTGQLGDAGLGLHLVLQQCDLELSPARQSYFISRLERPTARIDAGQALRGLVHAAIDLSDGLLADLGHILEASGVAATIELERLPVADEIRHMSSNWWQIPLTSGDDYELCFAVPPENVSAVESRLAALACPCTCIGRISSGKGLQVLHQGKEINISELTGYLHFA